MTGLSIPHPHAHPCTGEEIVHSHGKPRGEVNPLVVGSNPTGPSFQQKLIIMKRVEIKQARQELPDLIDRAEAGEEVIITRHGKAVAQLVAAPKTLKPLPSFADFRHGMDRPGTPAVQLVREECNAR